VNQFMVAANVVRRVGLPQDRVAERERPRELPVWEPMPEPLHAAAVELDHTATDSGMASRANADEADEQAEQRVRRGPDDGDDAKRNGDEGWGGHVCSLLALVSSHLAPRLQLIELICVGTTFRLAELPASAKGVSERQVFLHGSFHAREQQGEIEFQ
jgi:hypothetical protein